MFWLNYADGRDELPFLILSEGGETFTYAQVFQLADHIFSSLSRGVVAILCDRNIETVIGYLGALRHKHIPLLLPNDFSDKNLERVLNLYEVEYLFAPSERILSVYQHLSAFKAYTLWQCKKPDANFDANKDLALLIPTSGSTGDPKCVRLSHLNLHSCTESIINYLSIDKDRRAVSLLPLHYSYGLSVLNTIIGARGSYLFSKHSAIVREFWDDIVEFGVTDLSAVPFVYEALKRMRFSADMLSTLKCVTQAGGRLSPSLSAHFHKIFTSHDIRYFTMYGQTEASPRISYLKPVDAVKKLGSVGKVLDIGSVQLDKTQGFSGEGELIYLGPNVCLGYAENRTDIAKGDELLGVLKTGDLAKIDDDGFIFITGRIKRSIKINGVSVGLDFIEAKLQEQEFSTYVIGVDNEIIVATSETNEDLILKFVKEAFDFHGSIWRIKYLNPLPKTAAGKPDYVALQMLFMDDSK